METNYMYFSIGLIGKPINTDTRLFRIQVPGKHQEDSIQSLEKFVRNKLRIRLHESNFKDFGLLQIDHGTDRVIDAYMELQEAAKRIGANDLAEEIGEYVDQTKKLAREFKRLSQDIEGGLGHGK